MKNKKVLADGLLIGFFLLIALISYLVYENQKTIGSYVVVKVNNNEVVRYDISADGVYELNGGSNILVIKEGAVYLTEANCPDKLCVKQGVIRYAGQCLTCLPNKLTVTIEGEGGTDF